MCTTALDPYRLAFLPEDINDNSDVEMVYLSILKLVKKSCCLRLPSRLRNVISA